jgi:hypothetical protein
MPIPSKSTTTGSPLRLRKRELFAMLGYSPHAGQVLVHRSTAPRRVLACGVRWGKSTCAAMETVAGLLAPSQATTGWIVGPTYDLTDRIYKRVVAILEAKQKHRIRGVYPREHRIVVTNLSGGVSELRAKSADNPVSLLGEALDFVIVDEAAHLKREVWEEALSQRLVDRKGWALLLSTPRGCDLFYELFRRGQRGRDAAFESWASPSWDNPHLERALIEAERARLPEDRFAEQYEARFVGVPPGPCEVCGGPHEDNSGEMTALEGQHKDDFPSCSSCGMFVDQDGRCLVRKANEWYAHLHIDRPWSSPPSMSMYSWHVDEPGGAWKGRGE